MVCTAAVEPVEGVASVDGIAFSEHDEGDRHARDWRHVRNYLLEPRGGRYEGKGRLLASARKLCRNVLGPQGGSGASGRGGGGHSSRKSKRSTTPRALLSWQGLRRAPNEFGSPIHPRCRHSFNGLSPRPRPTSRLVVRPGDCLCLCAGSCCWGDGSLSGHRSGRRQGSHDTLHGLRGAVLRRIDAAFSASVAPQHLRCPPCMGRLRGP
mmetsp:Transcript_10071/g.20483  ORF Transcript_10071/g.20483 Transcript_10071/m.20483 type:complete len:209 (-) Transcript_10071:730-1356(-)